MSYMKKGKIVVSENGPYLVSGKIPMMKEVSVDDAEGNPMKWKKGKNYSYIGSCSLCRCGHSGHKPFCDGTHMKIKFNGKETAVDKKYIEQAGKLSGKKLDLLDAPSFCSSARFCHRKQGVWDLTQNSDNPKFRKLAIEEACNCPSGRLIACDKKGKKFEPKFKPSISFIEDTGGKCSGPIWVKGKIPIQSHTGKKYEIRNRVTLCRCGKSKNKPFCDGEHLKIGWKDD